MELKVVDETDGLRAAVAKIEATQAQMAATHLVQDGPGINT